MERYAGKKNREMGQYVFKEEENKKVVCFQVEDSSTSKLGIRW